MCVCIVCPAPLWVGGACLYVHACIGVCMYLSVSMYVCMYSLCVCVYTCNACCEALTQTNLLLLSLLLGGPNPFGGGGGPRTRNPGSYIPILLYMFSYLGMLEKEDFSCSQKPRGSVGPKIVGFDARQGQLHEMVHGLLISEHVSSNNKKQYKRSVTRVMIVQR